MPESIVNPFVTFLLEISAVPVLRYVQPVRYKAQLPLWLTPAQWRLHCLRKASASADFWAKWYRLCARRSLPSRQVLALDLKLSKP